MRDIKFRGKRLENGEWVYGNLVQIEGSYIYDYDIGDNGVEQKPILSQIKWNVNPETVGQYTGLKDKHGQDIYEGDILSDGDEYAGGVFWDTDKCTFMFSDTYPDNFEFDFLCDLDFDYFEVIGNIHENPKLFGGREMRDLEVDLRDLKVAKYFKERAGLIADTEIIAINAIERAIKAEAEVGRLTDLLDHYNAKCAICDYTTEITKLCKVADAAAGVVKQREFTEALPEDWLLLVAHNEYEAWKEEKALMQGADYDWEV